MITINEDKPHDEMLWKVSDSDFHLAVLTGSKECSQQSFSTDHSLSRTIWAIQWPSPSPCPTPSCVTIYFSFVSSSLHPVFFPPCNHLATQSTPYHLVTTSTPHHPITPSPCHLYHLISVFISSLPHPHPCLILALALPLPCPCPHLVLVLVLSLSSLLPHPCIPLSIPFLRHCISPSLVPRSFLVSILILMHHQVSFFSSLFALLNLYTLVSSLVLISTCSFI